MVLLSDNSKFLIGWDYCITGIIVEFPSREGVWVKFTLSIGFCVCTWFSGFLAYLNFFSRYLPNITKLRGTTTTPITIKTIVIDVKFWEEVVVVSVLFVSCKNL